MALNEGAISIPLTYLSDGPVSPDVLEKNVAAFAAEMRSGSEKGFPSFRTRIDQDTEKLFIENITAGMFNVVNHTVNEILASIDSKRADKAQRAAYMESLENKPINPFPEKTW